MIAAGLVPAAHATEPRERYLPAYALGQPLEDARNVVPVGRVRKLGLVLHR